MLALQNGSMMGLTTMGQPLHHYTLGADATVTQTVADRVAAIRSKMISLGIPVAVGTGIVTMLAFAGAFGLAKTERVWTPSIWLGALTTIGGLIGVATAAKAASDVSTSTATVPTAATTTTTPPATTASNVTVQPAAGFGY